jgi:glycosyltransferase involved in cell wall biosynthesis
MECLQTKKKILELCPFSKGVCGVWSRVKQESDYLSKAGYRVQIMSSNITKGSKDIAEDYDVIPGKEFDNDTEDVEIFRYPATKLGGESFMNWLKGKAIDKAIEYEPDYIVCHNYRHLHTTAALGIAKQLRKKGKECKVFLVTHAPFVEGNTTRSFVSALVVNLYDKFMGGNILNEFDRVITITDWENKYLDEIGCYVDKRAMIPNGLPREFFDQPKSEEINNTVLFLGRVAPIKKIETIIEAAYLLPDVQFSVVGPIEEDYMKELNKGFKEFPKNVTFYGAVTDINKKIEIIDKHKILVLPSKREAMPQVLLEGMARGKIVIASNTEGAREIIDDRDDGFLFDIGNHEELASLIRQNLLNQEHISMNAAAKAKKYYWGILIGKYIQLIEE